MKPEHIIDFTVPGEPKAWQRRVQTKSGNVFMPTAVQAFKALVQIAFAEAKPKAWIPWAGPVEMATSHYFPIPNSWAKWKQEFARSGQMLSMDRKDWDNLGKIISDALNNHAYNDDRQVAHGNVLKTYDKAEPRVRIVMAFYPEPTRELWQRLKA